MTPIKTPKKLIEVALPLDAINVACAREKSIRQECPRHTEVTGRAKRSRMATAIRNNEVFFCLTKHFTQEPIGAGISIKLNLQNVLQRSFSPCG